MDISDGVRENHSKAGHDYQIIKQLKDKTGVFLVVHLASSFKSLPHVFYIASKVKIIMVLIHQYTFVLLSCEYKYR